jgi:cold shock CspA family protein
VIGEVVAFDVEVGLGEVTSEDGAGWPFHCMAIADGSRRIDVGAPVRFEVVARLGRWEAWAIRPV